MNNLFSAAPAYLPTAPYHFLGQLDNFLSLPGPAPAPDAMGCRASENSQSSSKPVFTSLQPTPGRQRPIAPWSLVYESGASEHRAEYTNFGSDDTAYVFIDRIRQPPAVRWRWNR